MKTKVRLASLTLLACTAMLGGCATMISGTTQEMSFQSSPDDVVVTLIRTVKVPTQVSAGKSTQYTSHEETRILGKTPVMLQLDKTEESQSVVFSKEGYKPITMKLATTLDGWFWGNIVIGGVLGSATDSMSGAAHEYATSQFFVTLNPEMSTTIEQGTGQPQRDKLSLQGPWAREDQRPGPVQGLAHSHVRPEKQRPQPRRDMCVPRGRHGCGQTGQP